MTNAALASSAPTVAVTSWSPGRRGVSISGKYGRGTPLDRGVTVVGRPAGSPSTVTAKTTSLGGSPRSTPLRSPSAKGRRWGMPIAASVRPESKRAMRLNRPAGTVVSDVVEAAEDSSPELHPPRARVAAAPARNERRLMLGPDSDAGRWAVGRGEGVRVTSYLCTKLRQRVVGWIEREVPTRCTRPSNRTAR